eukprot:5052805-Pleurochrysis_carterae.AAC.2
MSCTLSSTNKTARWRYQPQAVVPYGFMAGYGCPEARTAKFCVGPQYSASYIKLYSTKLQPQKRYTEMNQQVVPIKLALGGHDRPPAP